MSIFMFGFIFCSYVSAADEEIYKNKMVRNMASASTWLIQSGVNTFFLGGKDKLHRKLVDEWGVLLWIEPWVETDDYLAQFRIKARGIHYQILNLYRKRVGDSLYEFWIVKIVAKPWSGEHNRSVFLVTQTAKKQAIRQILKRSDQFISYYKVDSKKGIHFPVDDLRLLYEMEAWAFSDNYLHSDLDTKKVLKNSAGNIELAN